MIKISELWITSKIIDEILMISIPDGNVSSLPDSFSFSSSLFFFIQKPWELFLRLLPAKSYSTQYKTVGRQTWLWTASCFMKFWERFDAALRGRVPREFIKIETRHPSLSGTWYPSEASIVLCKPVEWYIATRVPSFTWQNWNTGELSGETNVNTQTTWESEWRIFRIIFL